jgi:hypothetical protein
MTSKFFELINLKVWDCPDISSNPNTAFDIIQANPDKDWNWIYISQNPNITWDIIVENPDKVWDWSIISMKPNITWEIIQSNPNITIDIIQANPHKPWDWNVISRHKFYHDPFFQSNIYKKRETKKFMDTIRDELIQKTRTPSRMFNWNEDVMNDFKDDYVEECEKWRSK